MPGTISAPNAAIIRMPSMLDDVKINIPPLRVVATAEIAVTPSSYPAADYQVTNTVNWLDGTESMMVRIHKPDGTLIYEGILRKNNTATLVRLPAHHAGDGGIARQFAELITAGCIVTVYNVRIPKSQMSFIDESLVQFKRYDTPFDTGGTYGKATQYPKPITNMGSHQQADVNPTTGLATFVLNGSASKAWNGSPQFLWILPSGVTLTGGTLTSSTITVTAPAGYYEIVLRVSDSISGNEHRGYRWLFANDGYGGEAPAFSDRFALVEVEGDQHDRENPPGRRLTLHFETDADDEGFTDDIYTGAPVLLTYRYLFSDDRWETVERPTAGLIEKYVGYIRRFNIRTDADGIHHIALEVENPLMYFTALPIAAQHIIEADPPTNWQQIPSAFAHIAFAIFYMGEYQAPMLFQVTDLDLGNFETFKKDAFGVKEGTILSAFEQLVNYRTKSSVSCASDGTIVLRQHPWIEPPTYRDSLPQVWTWNDDDAETDLEYAIDQLLRIGVTEGWASIYGAGGTSQIFHGWTGGYAKPQAPGNQMLPNDLIAADAIDALAVISNYHQLTNAPVPSVPIKVNGGIDIVDPAYPEPHLLDYQLYNPLSGEFSEIFHRTKRAIPKSVTRQWNIGEFGIEPKISIVFEPETYGRGAEPYPERAIATPMNPIPTAPTQSYVWNAVGATPAGWSVIGTLSNAEVATWIGNTTNIAGTYVASRVPSDYWRGNNNPLRVGIKYVYSGPARVVRLGFSAFHLNAGSRRIGIAVRRADGVVEVLTNIVHTSGGAWNPGLDIPVTVNAVTELYFFITNTTVGAGDFLIVANHVNH